MGETTAAIATAKPAADFIAVEVHGPGVGSLLNRIAALGLSNLKVIRHDAAEVLRHMIAAGEGYSLLPLLAVQERGDLLGLIFYRPLHDGKAGRTIGLVWRSTDPRRAAFVDFSQMLRAIAPTGTAPTA